jgi:hypothetical protein
VNIRTWGLVPEPLSGELDQLWRMNQTILAEMQRRPQWTRDNPHPKTGPNRHTRLDAPMAEPPDDLGNLSDITLEAPDAVQPGARHPRSAEEHHRFQCRRMLPAALCGQSCLRPCHAPGAVLGGLVLRGGVVPWERSGLTAESRGGEPALIFPIRAQAHSQVAAAA